MVSGASGAPTMSSESEMEFADVEIGMRVEVEGDHGTVLFKGQVPPTKGQWLGVEWDDQTRGKHDGSHEGIRYFNTSHPTSGSFIRHKKANFGINFLEAVQDRYGKIDDPNAGVILEEMYVTGKNQHTTVEFVGAKSVNLKQSRFDQLRDVVVRGMPVRQAGQAGAVRSVVPNVEMLDISRTLLPSWHSVSCIARQLDKLHTLNISDNRLMLPDDIGELEDSFRSLQVLFINRTNITWDQFLTISKVMPNLQTLRCCFNKMPSFSPPNGQLQNLRLLHLEGNDIQVWENVLPLSELPKLEELILTSNGIEKVEFPDVPPGGTTKYFPQLKALSLHRNNLQEMKCFNELDKLASCEDLRIRFNPVTEDSKFNEETVRSIVIAKIAHLKVFNRSPVLSEERRGAEIDYLKMYGREWLSSGGNQDPEKNKPSTEFTQNHPRYQVLINLRGAPEDSELIKMSSALKSNLISVIIDCPQKPEIAAKTKKLPGSMLLQKLKALVARLYKADVSTLSLTYTSKTNPTQEFPMDQDMREIGFFAIDEGDTVHVRW